MAERDRLLPLGNTFSKSYKFEQDLNRGHGFTLDGLGEVRVRVRPEFVDRARELLRQVEAGELSLD